MIPLYVRVNDTPLPAYRVRCIEKVQSLFSVTRTIFTDEAITIGHEIAGGEWPKEWDLKTLRGRVALADWVSVWTVANSKPMEYVRFCTDVMPIPERIQLPIYPKANVPVMLDGDYAILYCTTERARLWMRKFLLTRESYDVLFQLMGFRGPICKGFSHTGAGAWIDCRCGRNGGEITVIQK